jgi:hypothetical protein
MLRIFRGEELVPSLRSEKMKERVLNPEQKPQSRRGGLVFISAGAAPGGEVLVRRFAGAVCDEGVDVGRSS